MSIIVLRGDLLDAASEGICEPETEMCLVITHPCDIANDKEESIEVIPCMPVDTENPMYLNGRNPRVLSIHPKLKNTQERRVFEVFQIQKRMISKQKLLSARIMGRLEPRELQVLPDWLSSRYRREELPNAIHDLVVEGLGMKKLARTKEFKELFGIWVSIENLFDGKERDDFSFEKYFSRLIFVYHSDSSKEMKASGSITQKLQNRISEKGLEANVSVHNIPSSSMTLDILEKCQRFNFDYLSI